MAGISKRPSLLPPINQKARPPEPVAEEPDESLRSSPALSLRSEVVAVTLTPRSSRHHSSKTPNPPTRRVLRTRGSRGGQRTSTSGADGDDTIPGADRKQRTERPEGQDDDGGGVGGGVLITQLRENEQDSDYDTDLESEGHSSRRKKQKPVKKKKKKPIRPKKKVEEENYRVYTEKQLYLKMCRNFGVVPVSYYVRNMEEPDLRMRYHGLGPSGTKALSVPLQINTCITHLDLEGNWMEAEGARHIALMLKENMFITELNLSYNRLKSTGAQLICRTIKKNVQLKKLDLSGNGFLDNDSQYFRELLEQNTTLRDLNLSNNEFSEGGATTLGRGIASNDTVEELDLSWNHIRLSGAEGIARGIRRNNGLVRLNLAMNGFAANGAKAMGTALESNNTLTMLDLSNNRVDIDGCNGIAKALGRNDTLKCLHIGLNPLTYSGALNIIKGIEGNTDSALEYLDLMGVLVHHEFMKFATDIQQQRLFEFKVGFVSTGKELDGDAGGFSDKNPLEILLIFMSEQNLRLVDLFKSLDKDQSMSLTRDEFIEGLKTVNTPLSQSQLDRLIDMLDKDGDGEVDLKEVLNINREYRDLKIKATKMAAQKKVEADKERLNAAQAQKGGNRGGGRKQAWQDSQSDSSRPHTGAESVDGSERGGSGGKSRTSSVGSNRRGGAKTAITKA